MTEFSTALPESAFAAPSHARTVLEAGLSRLLDEIVEKRVRRADAILPPLRDVRKETWFGAETRIQAEIEAYRADAESSTDAYIADAEAQLRGVRLAEQATGFVAKSALYETLTRSFPDASLLDWTSQMAPMLAKLTQPEQRFERRLRAIATGRLGVGAAYSELLTACQVLLDAGVRAIAERCRHLLHARLAAYTGQRLAVIRSNQDLLVATAVDDAKIRTRELAVRQTSIASRTTRDRHAASFPPEVEVIEQIAVGALGFMNGRNLDIRAFWGAFGAWATARAQLPAEETRDDGGSGFGQAIQLFLEEEAVRVFGDMTLSDVYATTGAPLPLAELEARSRVPVDLESVKELKRQVNQELSTVAVPAGLAVQLPPAWVVQVAVDPNRLKLLQDFRGFSARTVLGRNLPEWQAALDPRAIARETSTPILGDAIVRHRIVERIRGELASPPDDAAATAAPGPEAPPHEPADRGGAAAVPAEPVVRDARDVSSDKLSADERRLHGLRDLAASTNGSAAASDLAE